MEMDENYTTASTALLQSPYSISPCQLYLPFIHLLLVNSIASIDRSVAEIFNQSFYYHAVDYVLSTNTGTTRTKMSGHVIELNMTKGRKYLSCLHSFIFASFEREIIFECQHFSSGLPRCCRSSYSWGTRNNLQVRCFSILSLMPSPLPFFESAIMLNSPLWSVSSVNIQIETNTWGCKLEEVETISSHWTAHKKGMFVCSSSSLLLI